MGFDADSWAVKVAALVLTAMISAGTGVVLTRMQTTAVDVIVAAENIAEIRRDVARLEEQAKALEEEMSNHGGLTVHEAGALYVERMSNMVDQLVRIRQRLDALEEE